MRSLCIAVPRHEGETIRLNLSAGGFLRIDLRIFEKEGLIYIPVTEDPGMDFDLTEADFEEVEQVTSYKELADIPDELREFLPTSFDIIGDICIIKLGEELLPYSNKIGEAVLDANTNIKVVALDSGVKGEYRTRDLEIIAGENRTTTVHKEFGLRFEMDVDRMYFSPRLAGERKRISELVADGEVIIDMFAGVGPFSIMIAKHANPNIIRAIDINPEAFRYLEKNLSKNKVETVYPSQGDARDVIKGLANADRIIMNLPHSSLYFLDTGLEILHPGGMIHLYLMAENSEIDEISEKILEYARTNGYSISIENRMVVHTYSPTASLYIFDLLSTL
ncbi:MAG: class I SAM-dependent methyltransferase family protein [Thermoplasmata archaeon]|nr:class I SAM-dependent methyltransferase family protein [Thermoplasmata archaeon]